MADVRGLQRPAFANGIRRCATRLFLSVLGRGADFDDLPCPRSGALSAKTGSGRGRQPVRRWKTTPGPPVPRLFALTYPGVLIEGDRSPPVIAADPGRTWARHSRPPPAPDRAAGKLVPITHPRQVAAEIRSWSPDAVECRAFRQPTQAASSPLTSSVSCFFMTSSTGRRRSLRQRSAASSGRRPACRRERGILCPAAKARRCAARGTSMKARLSRKAGFAQLRARNPRQTLHQACAMRALAACAMREPQAIRAIGRHLAPTGNGAWKTDARRACAAAPARGPSPDRTSPPR